MKQIMEKRIELCRNLAVRTSALLSFPVENETSGGWFTFRRGDRLGDTLSQEAYVEPPYLNSSTVPVIVSSCGSAAKLKAELGDERSTLAWHPSYLRALDPRLLGAACDATPGSPGPHRFLARVMQPLYLLVHVKEFETYREMLREFIVKYRNMHLVGWDGGELTGFGASRAAALAFADRLSYCPRQILVMDQDVMLTPGTEHTSAAVFADLQKRHFEDGSKIVGLGVAKPSRDKHLYRDKKGEEIGLYPRPGTFQFEFGPHRNSPFSPKMVTKGTFPQQYVSIKGPFLANGADGIYPPYMVTGGEDMLMAQRRNLMGGSAIRAARIVKKTLPDEPSSAGEYGKQSAAVLRKLYEVEQHWPVYHHHMLKSLGSVAREICLSNYTSTELLHTVSSRIVERIILAYCKFSGEDIRDDIIFHNSRTLALPAPDAG